jgi:hypothetical protein
VTGLAGPAVPRSVIRVPVVVILPIEFFLESPGGILVGFRFYRQRRGLRLLPQAKPEALEVQLANPVLHGQLPLLLWIRARSNHCVGLEAQTLGHGDVVLVQPAELLRLRPTVPLRLLAHCEKERLR